VDESILFLSDSPAPGGDAPSAARAVAADRDEVAGVLGARDWRAICLDRVRVDEALADARWLRRRRNRLPVIALVDTADVARASELFACGVQEIVVRDASSDASLRSRVAGLVAPAAAPRPTGPASDVVARSAAMRACLELVRKAQRSDATVLLLGETGTGKEVLARTVHEGGRRARSPRRCSRASCSGTTGAPSPARIARAPATSCRPMAERSSSTRSARPRSASR